MIIPSHLIVLLLLFSLSLSASANITHRGELYSIFPATVEILHRVYAGIFFHCQIYHSFLMAAKIQMFADV